MAFQHVDPLYHDVYGNDLENPPQFTEEQKTDFEELLSNWNHSRRLALAGESIVDMQTQSRFLYSVDWNESLSSDPLRLLNEEQRSTFCDSSRYATIEGILANCTTVQQLKNHPGCKSVIQFRNKTKCRRNEDIVLFVFQETYYGYFVVVAEQNDKIIGWYYSSD